MSDTKRRANQLTGREWLRYSISIWSDIRKTPEELALGHPALFPQALVERMLACFTTANDRFILDPFAGVGSSLLAACAAKKHAIGLELNPDYCAIARQRLVAAGCKEISTSGTLVPGLPAADPDQQIATFTLLQTDARELCGRVSPDTVDFCITSPPYWNILQRRRSADGRPARHYGNQTSDLGTISDYGIFLTELTQVFEGVHSALRRGGYCVVVVMDLRKRNRFFPLHADLASRLQEIGFIYDDLILWDRRQEYNNLRPLGYPHKFRINKVHEFLLIFQKSS